MLLSEKANLKRQHTIRFRFRQYDILENYGNSKKKISCC